MTLSDNPARAVQNYLDAFNRNDPGAMANAFDDTGSILDGMPPHFWHGRSATTDWHRDVEAEGKHVGAGDYHVSLGEPLHNSVSGDAGYFVAPATMTFMLNGRAMTQTGAIFTVALRKTGDGWKIAAWAWAKGSPAQ